MWNKPTKEQLAQIPSLYSTDDTACDDKIIYLHFYVGRCDWHIVEFDGQDTFFGYANLGDLYNAEWGYISYQELQEININGFQVDTDLDWQPKKFSEITTGRKRTLEREYFTEQEALEKVGRVIETLVEFSGVPQGTTGTVIRADKGDDDEWSLGIQWIQPNKKPSITHGQMDDKPFVAIEIGKPLIDWFTKSEYDQYLKELTK